MSRMSRAEFLYTLGKQGVSKINPVNVELAIGMYYQSIVNLSDNFRFVRSSLVTKNREGGCYQSGQSKNPGDRRGSERVDLYRRTG
jgi:hypothetical protein